MARKRRTFEIFSMSFLDCICCGFGAVILLFMIINAQPGSETDQPTRLMAETSKLEYEILEKRKDLVLARNTMEKLEDERVRAATEIPQITALIEQLKIELAKHSKETLAKVEHVAKLQSDIESMEEEKKRLLALEQDRKEGGDEVRAYVGDGERQYLTGLKLGGDHILVLVDASASLLDRKMINILRRRNMPESVQLRAEKWRHAVNSVDWLSAHFPPGSKFQIYAFNTNPWPVLPGTEGEWLNVGDGKQLTEAVRILRRTVPEGGTNMLAAYEVINSLNPAPDNVILLTDGLPTMNSADTERGMVTGQERLGFFYEAAEVIPDGIPVNIFLYPLEGEYNAAIAYWMLAFRTGGSFIAVSEDWP